MLNKYGNVVLTPAQRQAKRRAFNRKYYATHRARLLEYNKNWKKYNDYNKKYYEAHKEENKLRAKEYYHRVLKVRKAAKLLVLGKVIVHKKDIVGNAEYRARIRHKYHLTKPQLREIEMLAKGITVKKDVPHEKIKLDQSVTPKKPWKRTP